MRDWSGKTLNGMFEVLLPAEVLRALGRHCREANSSETGGILIGHYVEDGSVAIVREATRPPSDSRRGRSWFVRGVDGLSDLLGQRWRSKNRTHYLGEWHFHPADKIEPSATDLAQMSDISRIQTYQCPEPVLLILGAGRTAGVRSFRAFVCPTGSEPLEFLDAGSQQTAVDRHLSACTPKFESTDSSRPFQEVGFGNSGPSDSRQGRRGRRA